MKSAKPTNHDKEWQKKVEENIKAEKVQLGHPGGKEKFNRVIKKILKKT
ncbi:MAG: hypothetical protein NTX11_00575 [Candidatus Saccharibacteria bacterium]|nr:hypothetical protein [Candidatus Saccharibacteria bacterium]